MGKGLDFLLAQQKPDGDLRGSSKAVGMYCHAMATLALCEAYALSLDEKLREPAERAVAFLARARARDGMAWRYLPGAQVGDTSILGWVVMALKSARESGLPIPGQASIQRGTLAWLDRVATGPDKGLARYQPWEPVTATMTAEAWVCRQFLGVGGPGASSTEAAASLLKNESDRGESNFYYWYYGTLAMYQHGGEPWTRWNDRVRDKIVGLQRPSGHQAGSWDPDDSMYGARGGRIYCTTLAALTLEVYYRYLRLYDEPKLPARAGDGPRSTARSTRTLDNQSRLKSEPEVVPHLTGNMLHDDRILTLYKRYREASRRLSSRLVQSLPKDAFNQGAKELGMLHRGTIVFDNEQDMDILADYCVHFVRSHGLNSVQRLLESSPPPADSDEDRVLTAMANSFYSVFEVKEKDRGVGVKVLDLLRGEHSFPGRYRLRHHRDDRHGPGGAGLSAAGIPDLIRRRLAVPEGSSSRPDAGSPSPVRRLEDRSRPSE